MITHIAVTSVILAFALAAARWIRPLTARTRHAILAAGMASLFLPSILIARAIETSNATVIAPLRQVLPPVPLAIATPVEATAFPWTKVIVAIWLAVASALLIRSLVITRRLLTNALRAASPPPQRTASALNAARHRLGVRTSIDLIASPLCEAPAVVRVLRPIIVLPADGCGSLDDEELESLLCHECAHVARRDNLLGLFETIAGAVLWFNPLVWIARRRIAAAREEACDERVADAAMPAETYVGALAKICRSLVAPRVAAVSCMANAHLKERIEHLMRYDTLRTSALSHRFMAVAATMAVALTVIAAGFVTAQPAIQPEQSQYQLNYTVDNVGGLIVVRMRIVDTMTNEIVGEPILTTKPGGQATTRFGASKEGMARECLISVDMKADGTGTMVLTITHNGTEVQRTAEMLRAPAARSRRAYSGEPISLDLVGADIRDVLRTFADLTGLEMTVAPDVKGTVTVHFKDVPWDEAFDLLLRQNGYSYRLEGKKIEVFKP